MLTGCRPSYETVVYTLRQSFVLKLALPGHHGAEVEAAESSDTSFRGLVRLETTKDP